MRSKAVGKVAFFDSIKVKSTLIQRFALAVLLALSLTPQHATQAATGTVTDCTVFDDGDGIDGSDTLGELLPGGGTITFDCAGTIIVPEMTISDDTTIEGNGNAVTLSGNKVNRVFTVNSGIRLTLDGMTVSKGSAGSGGGLYNNGGTVVIQNNSTFDRNDASSDSGAIANVSGGSVTIDNSTISNNTAGDAIGAILNGRYSTLTIKNNSLVTANRVTVGDSDGGGAIIHAGVLMTISDSKISNNSSTDGEGGAITIWARNGSSNISDSLFSGNSADSRGGAISHNAGTLLITNSHFTNNSAAFDGGALLISGPATIIGSTFSGNVITTGFGECGGGGISSVNNTLTLTDSTVSGNSSTQGGGVCGSFDSGTTYISNSTISGNTATIEGGGLHIGSNHTVHVSNTTISDNTAATGAGIHNEGTLYMKNMLVAAQASGDDCSDSSSIIWYVEGVNYADDATCTDFTNDAAAGVNLGALANNGGPTLTHALQSGNPAIDTATSCTYVSTDTVNTGNVTTDQRGVSRPQGAECDVGAFEFQLLEPLEIFDQAVDDGSLVGSGPGNSATSRLDALRNMLVEAELLFESGQIVEGCVQLQDAQLRVDGLIPPPDFATGEAAATLHAAIDAGLTANSCPGG